MQSSMKSNVGGVTSNSPILVMFLRGTLLFTVGCFFALILNLLQIQRNITLFNPEMLDGFFSSAWWVAPSCGTAAGELERTFVSIRLFVQLLNITCNFEHESEQGK